MTEQQKRELEALRKRLGAKVDPKVAERNWNRAWEANRDRATK
jgi:hypothetical protein